MLLVVRSLDLAALTVAGSQSRDVATVVAGAEPRQVFVHRQRGEVVGRRMRVVQVRGDLVQQAVQVAAAHLEVHVSGDPQVKSMRDVDFYRRDIAAARDEVERHARFSVGAGAVDLARLAPCFTAFREQIEERLERVEYGLIDDEEALEAGVPIIGEPPATGE